MLFLISAILAFFPLKLHATFILSFRDSIPDLRVRLGASKSGHKVWRILRQALFTFEVNQKTTWRTRARSQK